MVRRQRADSAIIVPGASAIDRVSDSTAAQPHEQVADFAAMLADRRNRKTPPATAPTFRRLATRRDAIAILLAFFLVGLPTGLLDRADRLVPQHRGCCLVSRRNLTAYYDSVGVLPLIVFAAVVLLRAGCLPNVTKIIAIVLFCGAAILSTGNNCSFRPVDAVYANMTIDDARPDEQSPPRRERSQGIRRW